MGACIALVNISLASLRGKTESVTELEAGDSDSDSRAALIAVQVCLCLAPLLVKRPDGVGHSRARSV